MESTTTTQETDLSAVTCMVVSTLAALPTTAMMSLCLTRKMTMTRSRQSLLLLIVALLVISAVLHLCGWWHLLG